jgi:hypothetical protein
LISGARGAYGTALLLAPARVLAAYGAPADREAPRAVARVLGARHVAQALATDGGRFVRLGAAVDALHAATMFGLAATSDGYRRPALIDGAIASTFALSGLFVLRSRSYGSRS